MSWYAIRRRGKRTKRFAAPDALWARYIKTRDGWTCRRCGRSKTQGYQMHAAHVLSRRSLAVRWDPDAGLCCCALCHRWLDDHKSRSRDGDGDVWAKAQIGTDAYIRLVIRAGLVIKPDPVAARKVLRDALDRLETV